MKGIGVQQDYGMRIYDTRIAKFLSVDPLWKEYAWYTPYQFAGNKPIRYIDRDGAEEWDNSGTVTPYIKPIPYKQDVEDVYRFCINNFGFALYNAASGAINAIPASYNYLAKDGNSISSAAGELNEAITHADRDNTAYFTKTSGRQILKDALNSFTKLENYDQAAQLWMGYKMLPVAKGTPLSVELSTFAKRNKLAKEFFEKSGVSNVQGHMAAIHFENAVYTEVLPEGAILYRYSEIGTTNPKHYFFKELQTAPGEVGKMSMYNDPSKFVKEKFTLKKEVKVLNTTTDLGGEAGAGQVFSTEVEGASTVEQINAETSKPR